MRATLGMEAPGEKATDEAMPAFCRFASRRPTRAAAKSPFSCGGYYKSAGILKDGVLVGITPENSDPAAVEAAFVSGRLIQTLERTQKTIRPQYERQLG